MLIKKISIIIEHQTKGNKMDELTLKEMMAFKAKLHTKINEVVTRLGAIHEDGKNIKHAFGFISYQKMNAELRKVLPIVKLSISPALDSYEERDYQNANGNVFIRTVATMIFEVVDTETGYSEFSKFGGGEQDYGGKSLGQAITECQKRFEFKKFHVSSKDPDPDEDPKPIAGKKEEAKSEPSKPLTYQQQLNDIDAIYQEGNISHEDVAHEMKCQWVDLYNVKDVKKQDGIIEFLQSKIKKGKK